MSEGNSGSNAIASVLAALERLVADLRERTEAAERRTAAADERAALERQAREIELTARHDAELRAAAAEARARLAEAAAAERNEQLLREILATTHAAADAAVDAAAALRATSKRPSDPARSEYPDSPANREALSRRDRGEVSDAEVAPHRSLSRRRSDEGGYAWIEDKPGPSWWRRVFRWR